MAQASETYPDLTYDDISDEYTRFEARISPTNVKGVKHLNLVVDRPFRSSDELSAWLHAYVARLGADIENKVVIQDG